MKPITLDILGTSVTITNINEASSGLDIDYDHDGSVDKETLDKAVGDYIIEALEEYIDNQEG